MWHKRSKIAIDIGGSGTRWISVIEGKQSKLKKETIHSINHLMRVIKFSCENSKVDGIALSIAGFVNSEKGEVLISRNAPWLVGDLRDTLHEEFPTATIHIVNDGEAHALSLLSDTRTKLGAINLSIGTSVALGVLDVHGEPIRSASGTNWDVGDFQIKTSASNSDVWWALGSYGLGELEQRYGDLRRAYEQFGYRLGSFLSQLAVIFRPNTIGLSGGIITKGWSVMERTINEEFKSPVKLHPQIIKSQFEESAIIGLLNLF